MGARLRDETPTGSDEKRIQQYLAGRLDAAEAELFEQRLFADDELAAEVERALEIRAATTHVATKHVASGPPRRVLFALAAAAGAAALAVGLLWLQPPPAEPVFRGVEQRMGLEIEEVGGGAALLARWQPVAGAAGYEVQVLAGDGSVLITMETDDREMGYVHSQVDPAPAFIEVSALDELGQTLRSERLAVPGR